MEEAMKSMRWRKLRVVVAAAAVLISAALIAPFGVSAWAGGDAAEKSQATTPAPEPKPAPLAAAAAPGKKPAVKPKKVVATKKQKAEVVREANAFAFDFYAQLRKEQAGKNIFYSPFSISSALAMTYAGANGNTATQMAKVMHFDLEEQELHPAFSDLTEELNERGKTANFRLAVANRLWGQEDYNFLQNFLEMNKLYYGAGIERVNFKKDPEGSRKTINAWIEKKTEDRIKNLIAPRALKPVTRLVLTNAIYFKADWRSQFKKRSTRERVFNVSAGKQVKVPTMCQMSRFPYAQCDGFKVLEMPYKGDELAMVVLLPDRKSSLDVLEKKLTAKTLEDSVRKLRAQRVLVYLPKFEMTLSLSLKDYLEAMGMTDAFKFGPADFSGMDGTRYLYIAAIVHKAFVRVDEKGTEAAAATAVMMAGGGRPKYQQFTADRPFVFLIRDKKTGSILFMGRVVNPKG
jgi:serpin B